MIFYVNYECRGFFEHGNPLDDSYFNRRKIVDGDIVYVATADMPAFIDVFLSLPSTTRIILVTGCEDIGVPFELFHPNRPNFFVGFIC